MKKTVIAVLVAVVALSAFAVSGCGGEKYITTGKIGVVKDEEFNNVYIELSIDGFNALGFEFGDSVDIFFDNGKSYKDVPYYSGYYVPVGELLACGYPGYPHVVIARNYGKSTWEEFGMTETSEVEIILNRKGKYLAREELYQLNYSDDRTKFESDIMFANFRAVRGGNLRENYFYRSASPCDNQHQRAAYANALAEDKGIRFVLNLSDNRDKYDSYTQKDDFQSEYYNTLVESGNVLLLALNANYRPDEFKNKFTNAFFRSNQFVDKLSLAFYEMAERADGACLIHCVEGKDRTGFACSLLLALAGASAQEIVDDYMITYYNYYGITPEGMPEKYRAIKENVDDFLYCLCDAVKGTDINGLDLIRGARSYLKKGGLSDTQVEEIENYITAAE
ncbi:MAG: tyrosine-protein phosphatase [Clostridia bacterium]|nr:tyrosine-protein phosphatase [Clostridia bacterium]